MKTFEQVEARMMQLERNDIRKAPTMASVEYDSYERGVSEGRRQMRKQILDGVPFS